MKSDGTLFDAEISSKKISYHLDSAIMILLREIRIGSLDSERKNRDQIVFLDKLKSESDLLFLVSEDSTIIECDGYKEYFYKSPTSLKGNKIINILPKELAKLSKTAINKTLMYNRTVVAEYELFIEKKSYRFEAKHFPSNKKVIISIKKQ